MTDARLPERYLMDRRFMRLTDPEFRAFVLALLWSVSNRTDGFVERDDLPLIPGMTGTCVAALVLADLWRTEGTGFRMVDYDTTQTSKSDLEVLERARKADREKKARTRAGMRIAPVFTDSPGDAPGDLSQVQHRQVQGKGIRAVEPVTDWHVATIPKDKESA